MFSFLLLLRSLFTMTRRTGVIRMNTTFLEGRLGLTCKRPSYHRTGTHLSPRSVLVWRSANRSTSSSLRSSQTLCTHWSLTGNTAPPHWVVTRGRSCLVHRPHCRLTVTGKGSMLCPILKQESAFLATTKITVSSVIPESGLVQEGLLMIPTRVETSLGTHQIMERNTSKPWVTSWCSEKKLIWKL